MMGISICLVTQLHPQRTSASTTTTSLQPNSIPSAPSTPTIAIPFTHRIYSIFSSGIELWIFLLMELTMGIAGGIHSQFLWLFLSDLGASQLLLGLSTLVTCSAELPFFYYAKILLRKLGPLGVIYTSLFCYGVRMMYYSFLTSPWWVLPGKRIESNSKRDRLYDDIREPIL